MKYLNLPPLPVVKKWTFIIAIAINTVLAPFSVVVLDSIEMAIVNIASGLLCWLGYFSALEEIKNKVGEEDGE